MADARAGPGPVPRWLVVRGSDGRMLFRHDPTRCLVEVRKNQRFYLIDLRDYRLPGGDSQSRDESGDEEGEL